MKPTIIIYSLLIFFTVLFLQALAWKLFRPRNRIGLLFIIYFFVPAVILTGYFLLIASGKPLLIAETLLIWLLYFSIAGVYVQTYPALEIDSPSIRIVYLIGKKKAGMTLNDLAAQFEEEELIMNRFRDLEEQGFIRVEKADGAISLAGKGKALAEVFILYRKLLGIEAGKG